MNNNTLTAPLNKLKSSQHPDLTPPSEFDFLTVSFSPGIKLLCAHWLKPVSSAEYRQAVRMIARTIVFLRAELTLIDVSVLNTISEDDQLWTGNFLKNALSKSAIRRSARVLSPAGFQPQVMQNIINETGKLAYEVKIFHELQEAKCWLLEGLAANITEQDGEIKIPLNFNLKLLRREVLQQNGHNRTSADANTANPTAPNRAYLPDGLSIRTDFVSISLSHEESLMSIRWKKAPVSRQYRFGMLKAGRALMEHKLERVLLNNQRLGVLTLEDQGWLVSTSIELLPRTSLRKLAVVTSADAMQQMSSEAIGCKLREAKLPYEAKYFLSEEEAREWLLLD